MTDHHPALKRLLESSERELFVQGLELLDALELSERELFEMIGCATRVVDIFTMKRALPQYHYRGTLLVWILGRLAELGVSWASTLTKLDVRSSQLIFLSEKIEMAHSF